MSDVPTDTVIPTKKKFNMSFLFTLLFIGLLAGSIYWEYQLYLQAKQSSAQQQQLTTRIQTIEANTQTTLINTRAQFEAIQQQIAKLTAPDTLNTEEQWSLHKALYAIQLAQFNAQWSNDAATTISLLQQADKIIAHQNNQELLPIRQALAREITAQQLHPTVDTSGILSQLDALSLSITACAFTKSSHHQDSSIATANNTVSTQNHWRTRLWATLLSFKQFFIVRHHESPLEPLMTPAFQTAQKEIIRLNLQKAEWAVLEKNDGIYQIELRQADENITRAFGADNTIANGVLKQLKQLSTITLQTTKLIPNESLPLLEAIIKNNEEAKSTGVTS